ncbi:MAG TPA: hypothetical protein VFR27_02305 [Mycobacterium sp.]|nr:hypothetical protein [Mycobacterium sp.]
MNDVNFWLMALAFLLGAVLTFTLMIRRVKGEVPGSPSGVVPAAGATGFAGGRSGAESEPANPKPSDEAS